MNDLAALEQKHKEMGLEIERLKKVNEDVRWKPKHGDVYSIVDSDCEIFSTQYICDNVFYMGKKDCGNIFSSKEKAEKHAKRIKVFNLLHQYAEAMNDGVDLKTKYKHYVVIKAGGIISNLHLSGDFGAAGFYNIYDMEKAIELIGEDVIIDAWS